MKTIKAWMQDYPIVAIGLLLLACVKFEYRAANWTFGVPGLVGGVVVLGIIATVLLFRIFNAVQDACIARGLIASRIRSKYDLLIPIGIVAAAIQARFLGEWVEDAFGRSGYRWDFQWSDPEWNGAFIGALVGVVLLVRILYLVRAIGSAAGVKSA